MKIQENDDNNGNDNIDQHVFDLNGLNLDGSPANDQSKNLFSFLLYCRVPPPVGLQIMVA